MTKIESLKFFMKMNLPIYYSHLPSKSFFPITLNTFTDTETHNVPSMSHKLPMKHKYFVSVLCLAYARQGILSKVGCPHPSAWPPHLNCLLEMFSKPAVLVGTHALFFCIRLSLPSLPCVHLISTTNLQSIPANSWVI